MASINSDGRTIQAAFAGGSLPPGYGETERIKIYRDKATLTGVAATQTVTFREGIPNGALILTAVSYLDFDDLGTGGTIGLGFSGTATAFCSAVDTDTADGRAYLSESTTYPDYYKVTTDNFKPLLTRNTADVTGSPTVSLTIMYLDPTTL